jgi:hypothetical protein
MYSPHTAIASEVVIKTLLTRQVLLLAVALLESALHLYPGDRAKIEDDLERLQEVESESVLLPINRHNNISLTWLYITFQVEDLLPSA